METQQCREIKELNLFEKGGRKSNGEQYYRPDCKECRKPIVKEQGKNHRQKNKERIEAKAGEKIPCECGMFIRRDGLSRHQTSLQHLDRMELL
jgi:hypothetical protein